MRIFFVCQRVPFPPNRGDKITTFNEIRHLSRHHEVHVFCLADSAQDLENVGGLLAYAKEVTAVPSYSFAGKLRALRALIAGGSLSVAMLSERKLHAAIQEKFSELKPDLIFIYSCNVAQFAAHFPSVPRIMQVADLDSLKWGQYAERSAFPMKWIYRTEKSRLLEYERHIAHTFTHSLVCTAIEKADFERLIPGRPVTLVGNGVDLEYFRGANHPKKPGSIICTGVMDYFPNIDAVTWFCDAILPIVQEQIPTATFTICGSRPTKSVRQLAKRRGVFVTGWVQDTRPFLDSSEVFVAPLRIARGIQNKLLEALAMGLPCVSSTAAWRSTVVQRGEGVLDAVDPRQFAEHVIHLLRDGNYRREMGLKARAAAETHYTWDAQLKELDRIIGLFDRASRPAEAPTQPELPEEFTQCASG